MSNKIFFCISVIIFLYVCRLLLLDHYLAVKLDMQGSLETCICNVNNNLIRSMLVLFSLPRVVSLISNIRIIVAQSNLHGYCFHFSLSSSCSYFCCLLILQGSIILPAQATESRILTTCRKLTIHMHWSLYKMHTLVYRPSLR